VQQALVPQRDEQGVGWLSWAGHFRQAGEAGSDFWHAYPLSDDRVLVVIGDATGAGLGGSMVSAVVKSCCDSFAGARGARLEPDELLAAINRALWRPRKPIHMTCFAAVFDNEQRRLRFASAGHRFPYTVTSKGLSVLRGAGPVLGDDFDSTYRTMSQPFAVGDTFVLYTNGVVEARNAAGVAWGERRMQKQLQQLALGYVASVTGVRDAIRAAADAHSGDIAVADDQAMVIVRVER
jgi:sigma-B regulation protein RsbU (phosphoserine phosphatase)